MDISDRGYAGYTVEHGCHTAHGQWLPNEGSQSSTWRELRAVRLVLEDLMTKLKNQRVRWFTDNQYVCRIILTGSRKPLVRWLSKIFVTGWIKAPFLVHRFFMMYLLILEGVPSRTTYVQVEKQNGHQKSIK